MSEQESHAIDRTDGAGPRALLEAYGVEKGYRIAGSTLHVLRGVDLEVHEGEILAVLGTSGCGKSTLLHVLGWLDRADAGQILYEGRDHECLSVSERARLRNLTMGFVFQFYHLFRELTALENVMVPAMIRFGPTQWRDQKRDLRERAKALLAIVGLGHRIQHKPPQLSGGERQRVAIARALVNAPRFLLCDEPTGNLDGRTAEDIRRVLWELNERHRQTMIVVTHDAKLAQQAHRTVHLVDGRVCAGDDVRLVEEIEHPDPS